MIQANAQNNIYVLSQDVLFIAKLEALGGTTLP
jgi:hypothetical protein